MAEANKNDLVSEYQLYQVVTVEEEGEGDEDKDADARSLPPRFPSVLFVRRYTIARIYLQ
jgi:hypothetical protein